MSTQPEALIPAAAHFEVEDGLTEEERAALTADEGAENVDTTVAATDDSATAALDDQETKDAAAAEPDAAAVAVDPVADAGAADVAAAAAIAEPAAATPVEAASKPSPAPAPLLVATAPADADAQLAKIATDKAALADKFDEGDLTAREYQAQLDTLNKAELNLTLDVREAQLAAKLELQREKNDWDSQCSSFLASHPEYDGGKGDRFIQLNETIKAIARMPSNAGISGDKLLAKAHAFVQMELGETPAKAPVAAAAAPAAKPALAIVPKPVIPPNIGKLPAADMSDTNGGEFAALERLASSDPIAYEEQLNSMSEAARNKYLRA